MLNRDDILKASDIKVEPVLAWGGTVYVKGMTGKERDQFEASIIQMRGNKQNFNLENVRAKLCVLTICDESGNRLFTDADLPLLAEKSAQELQKIFIVAQRLSGITEEDLSDYTKELGELEGNKVPFGGSASD